MLMLKNVTLVFIVLPIQERGTRLFFVVTAETISVTAGEPCTDTGFESFPDSPNGAEEKVNQVPDDEGFLGSSIRSSAMSNFLGISVRPRESTLGSDLCC